MNYDFPLITNISDFDFLRSEPEFIFKEELGMTIIFYAVSLPDTFPLVVTREDALRRECRGITFDTETGDIVSRPYTKFFNLNERQETLQGEVDFNEPHRFLNKLDGCCDENTILQTPDGDITIKDLCDQKYMGLVLGSFDHTNPEWVSVLGHEVKCDTDNWYELVTDCGDIVILTGNHKVWSVTRGLYISVDSLELGEEFLTI